MKNILIAKIAVASAVYAIDKPYDYLVPEALLQTVTPGIRVIVPFGRGNRRSEGLILSVGEGEKRPGLKAIARVLDTEPVLDSQGIALALWLRQRYFCTMYEAVKTILPAGLWYDLRETYRLKGKWKREDALAAGAGIPGGEAALCALFASGGSASADALRKACGDSVGGTLKVLCEAGILEKDTSAKRKISDKTRRIAILAVSAEDALAQAESNRRKAPVRYEAVCFLAANGRASVADICYYTGATTQTLKSLEKSGILTFADEEELRLTPLSEVAPGAPITLNDAQENAFRNILNLTKGDKASAALLRGVTGSGKTQIYIRLAQELQKRNKTAIILVPEIILTPQIMEKFVSYFGDRVALLHSSLRLSERYDQWKRIRRGEVDVVLGTRSAVFAPLQNLGMIVLDEEQEHSYQSENQPPYHAREVAMYRCGQDSAVLLLGSATPSIESEWAAREGRYHLELLPNRYNEQSLPQVLIADMREEVKAGNGGMIGRVLQKELEKNLSRGEQSILFLNRRGNSRMLLCGECGWGPECPQCSVRLTYHSANQRLMCHYCGYSQKAYDRCPHCGGIMRRVGAGTQKVEEELRNRFPGTDVLRMDADTATAGHAPLLRKFAQERIPILLGTQMVTKGLDFENVTLVGVLAADLSLYMDSYRASERTFHLLTQVVGRAGRGDKEGRAVIQTYTPENEVIQSAAAQDFERFYENELHFRRLQRYPPFADLFALTVSGPEEGKVLQAAMVLRDTLRNLFASMPNTEILGPAPATIVKLNNRFRYRVLLTGRNDVPTRNRLSQTLKEFHTDRSNRGLRLTIECNGQD